MIFLLPPGIGDNAWALHKIQNVSQKLGDGKVEILVACDQSSISLRSLEFLRRFHFVNSVRPHHFMIHTEGISGEDGFFFYHPDGYLNANASAPYFLIPNAALERGLRLEEWLPNFKINWEIPKDFMFRQDEIEYAEHFARISGDYVVFYAGPEIGNTTAGHNRKGIWPPLSWATLGKKLYEAYGTRTVLVGADYDLSYYYNHLKPQLEFFKYPFTNLIGQTEIGYTYAIIKKAKCVISYQSGIGIFASYLGVPTGIFWRQKGDSIEPNRYLSFDEAMAHSWVNPTYLKNGNYLPLYYGRHDVDFIISEIAKRGWLHQP